MGVFTDILPLTANFGVNTMEMKEGKMMKLPSKNSTPIESKEITDDDLLFWDLIDDE